MKLADLTSIFSGMPARRKQFTVSAGIVITAVLASASIFATGPDNTPQTRQEKAWPVSITQAQPASAAPNFQAYGKLQANRVAKLRSDIVARITGVLVNEGDWAEQDEILVQLDPREFELIVLEREADLAHHTAELASAQSKLALAKQNHEHFRSRFEVAEAKLARHQDLMEKRLIAKSLLDEVTSSTNQISIEFRAHEQELEDLPNRIAVHEARLRKAKALLEQAKINLDKTQIRAPFAGPILSVLAAPGDHSNLSVPLIHIADANSFEVRVQVPQAHAQVFHRALDGVGNNSIHALSTNGPELTLRRLSNQVRSGQTGLDAFFVFNHPPAHWALGQVIELHVELPEQHNLLALPVQALYENKRIYAVKDSRLVGFDIRKVGERESPEHGYQVLVQHPDIQPGDKIVTTQLPRAITGLLVDVTNSPDVTGSSAGNQHTSASAES